MIEKPKKVGDRAVKHHCHYIIGPNFECLAHSLCNTVLRHKWYIPVGFHNLSYDIKNVLEALSQIEGFNLQYEPLAKSSEKFLTLKISWSRSLENNQERRYSILFFDTFAFLPKSLEILIAVQKSEDPQSFQILSKSKEEMPYVHFIQNFEILENLKSNSLVIFDDLATHMKKHSEKLLDLWTVESHHMNISVILVLHNLFQQTKSIRTISLNKFHIV